MVVQRPLKEPGRQSSKDPIIVKFDDGVKNLLCALLARELCSIQDQ
jgi:hypothetical protein